jgi:hypothetical protein
MNSNQLRQQTTVERRNLKLAHKLVKLSHKRREAIIRSGEDSQRS